jgi:hypothetical protein
MIIFTHLEVVKNNRWDPRVKETWLGQDSSSKTEKSPIILAGQKMGDGKQG